MLRPVSTPMLSGRIFIHKQMFGRGYVRIHFAQY
jgi:hypothetical protein